MDLSELLKMTERSILTQEQSRVPYIKTLDELQNLDPETVTGLAVSAFFEPVESVTEAMRIIAGFGKIKKLSIYADISWPDLAYIPKRFLETLCVHVKGDSNISILDFPELRELSVYDFDSGEAVNHRTKYDFSGVPKLQKLLWKGFHEGCFHGVVGLDELKELKVFQCGFDDMEWLSEIPLLKVLHISECNIKSVDAITDYQYNVEELDLSCNQIRDISKLSQLKRLQNIDLWRNPIIEYGRMREIWGHYLNVTWEDREWLSVEAYPDRILENAVKNVIYSRKKEAELPWHKRYTEEERLVRSVNAFIQDGFWRITPEEYPISYDVSMRERYLAICYERYPFAEKDEALYRQIEMEKEGAAVSGGPGVIWTTHEGEDFFRIKVDKEPGSGEIAIQNLCEKETKALLEKMKERVLGGTAYQAYDFTVEIHGYYTNANNCIKYNFTLPILLAIYSSLQNISVQPGTLFIGTFSHAGNLRSENYIDLASLRMAHLRKVKRIVVSSRSREWKAREKENEFDVIRCKTIDGIKNALFEENQQISLFEYALQREKSKEQEIVHESNLIETEEKMAPLEETVNPYESGEQSGTTSPCENTYTEPEAVPIEYEKEEKPLLCKAESEWNGSSAAPSEISNEIASGPKKSLLGWIRKVIEKIRG